MNNYMPLYSIIDEARRAGKPRAVEELMLQTVQAAVQTTTVHRLDEYSGESPFRQLEGCHQP